MHSIFDPGSPQAREIAHLWWWMFGVAAAVWLAVVIASLVPAFRARGHRESDGLMHVAPERHARIERTIALLTFGTVLVLAAFLTYDFTVGRLLAQHPQSAVTIDVTGHQWWWEVQYEDPDPSKRIITANEIHVPTGQPIQFKLRSTDVIHSFWAPNLQGKRDLIPGYTSTHWFKADTAGVYRGQCAEFCGLEHAKMSFYIIAESPTAFQAWLAAGASAPLPPTDSTLLYGQRIFLTGGCSACHTVGGTPAQATVGPPLTHLKSRNTIAAGTLANTRANLTAWVANPQAIKPGARMPPSPLTKTQLDALVSYLETLK
jgi:cytochrome c oxidase subunit 2